MKSLSKKTLDAYISSGIGCIGREQDADGAFFGYILDPWSSDRESKAFKPTFVSLLVAPCLASIRKSAASSGIRRKLETFILRNRSAQWTWNYWPLGAIDRQAMNYPDDMDDTACALIALMRNGSEEVDGSVMAHIVNALALLEVREGGPYRTWLVGEGFEAIWMDVDLAVNSNIAYLLSLFDIELPELTAFIEEKIDAEAYESPYYVPPFPLVYFISRFYKGSKRPAVVKYLLDRRREDGSWGNVLNTALAVSVLLNFGHAHKDVEKSVALLLEADGKWGFDPFYYYDVSDPERKMMVGAPALTAAFCIEAVAKYRACLNHTLATSATRKKDMKEADEIYAVIVDHATEYLRSCGKNIGNEGVAFLDTMLTRDTERQISLLPYFFRRALGNNGDAISKDMLVALGTANLYGWMAYSIYDDFLDREGDPALISAANACLRRLTLLFASVSSGSDGFDHTFESVMNGVDEANAWEVAHCRAIVEDGRLIVPDALPDFGDHSKLAERSFGHALGPIAVMSSLGYDADSEAMKDAREFFHHFIIARQLNDDAHDWEEDLRRGIVNSVGTGILGIWKHRNEGGKKIDLETDAHALQEICWNEIMPGVCEEIIRHAEIAEQSLNRLDFPNPEYLELLIEGQKKSARKALHEREEALKFLQAYAAKESDVCPR